MPERLIIAYLLILLLAAGVGVAIWMAIYNSPRQKMKRHYRAKRHRARP